MSFITCGHFTAYVDAYDTDYPVIEIKMESPIYTDRVNGWKEELMDEMQKLEKGVANYLSDVKALREEARAYAV